MSEGLPQLPVFLVSMRYRQEVETALAGIGRNVMPARRPLDAARRFEQSPALIALVDARGAFERGVEIARELAPIVEKRRAALLLMVSRGHAGNVTEIQESGATHVLTGGFKPAELQLTLGLADRYIRRLHTSGINAAIIAAHTALADAARWEWRKGEAFVRVTPGLARLMGEPAGTERVPVGSALEHVEEADREDMLRGLLRVIQGGISGEFDHQMRVDGRLHTIAHHVRANRAPSGELRGLTATVEDLDAVILERRASAHFDMLTGLANASFARGWIDQLLGGRSAFEPACIVLLLSISRFDGINAAYGRSVADALLQAVARRVRRVTGGDRSETLLIARMAGAEFAVGFAGPITLAEVIALAHRLAAAFDRPFLVGGRVIHLACRMGVAVGEAELDGADTLLRRASAALARAKAGDPNSFEIFMGEGGDDALARMASLETDLRQALEADELDILFQPQVEIASNRIVGVEALTRWRHPILGLLPAETLLGVAENAEVTTRLSGHILKKAMGEAAHWGEALGSLRLSVNVTADDMATADFPERVVAMVSEAGFPPERLTIEVTESGLMRDVEHAARALARLREHGVKVAIDDFGTGYSSLAYLKALPLDTLKVDKRLVTDLFGSARDRIVVRGVVDMARSLGMLVVAEGVETEGQLDALVREGCNWYQGFLCSPPVTTESLQPLVEEWNGREAAVA